MEKQVVLGGVVLCLAAALTACQGKRAEETSRQLEEMKEKGLNVNDTIDLTEFKEAVREVYESEGLTEARDKLLSAIQ